MSKLVLSKRSRLLAGAAALFISSSVAQDAIGPSDAQIHDYIKQASLIGFEWVFQPLDRIVLVRGEHAFCAIRFTSYSRLNDGRPPTPFDTGSASELAVYEVSEISVKDAKFVLGPVVRKELNYRGLRGLGRLAFHVGEIYLRCGKDRYSWIYPTGIRLEETHTVASVAPTNWLNFGDVHLDNPKLRWYQRDPQLQRPFIVLPLEDLPP